MSEERKPSIKEERERREAEFRKLLKGEDADYIVNIFLSELEDANGMVGTRHSPGLNAADTILREMLLAARPSPEGDAPEPVAWRYREAVTGGNYSRWRYYDDPRVVIPACHDGPYALYAASPDRLAYYEERDKPRPGVRYVCNDCDGDVRPDGSCDCKEPDCG